MYKWWVIKMQRKPNEIKGFAYSYKKNACRYCVSSYKPCSGKRILSSAEIKKIME